MVDTTPIVKLKGKSNRREARPNHFCLLFFASCLFLFFRYFASVVSPVAGIRAAFIFLVSKAF